MPVYTEKERTMNPFRTNESPECTEGTCDMHKRRVRWQERRTLLIHGVFGTVDPSTNAKFFAALMTAVLTFAGFVCWMELSASEAHRRQDHCFKSSLSVRESVRACARGGNLVRSCKARELEIHEDCLDIPR